MRYPKRFVILCHPRTGSTLAGSLLASHPAVHWDGEHLKRLKKGKGLPGLFRRVVRRFPVSYLNLRAQSRGKPAYGCKLLPRSVRNIDQSLGLLHRSGWLIIHLWRRDLFQAAISHIVSTHTNHWMSSTIDPALAAPTLAVTPELLLNHIQRHADLQQSERRALRHVPSIELVYEDDLADAMCWQAAIGRIWDRLGLARVAVHTTVTKTWSKPYHEMIENYDELVEAVRNSPFAMYAPGSSDP
jgi:LPS sulfotransferase NodH